MLIYFLSRIRLVEGSMAWKLTLTNHKQWEYPKVMNYFRLKWTIEIIFDYFKYHGSVFTRDDYWLPIAQRKSRWELALLKKHLTVKYHSPRTSHQWLWRSWSRGYCLWSSACPGCTNTTGNQIVPSFSLQWKSDESTKHYLTQMLLTINWHYWQAGKKSLIEILF